MYANVTMIMYLWSWEEGMCLLYTTKVSTSRVNATLVDDIQLDGK